MSAGAAGRLTTHVLDTASGLPAAGVKIELFLFGEAAPLKTIATNHDGRADSPLLAGPELKPGRYELRFHVGDYHRGLGLDLPDPPFLDVVPLAFGVADANAHYHVPLLISPFAYSTYRGS